MLSPNRMSNLVYFINENIFTLCFVFECYDSQTKNTTSFITVSKNTNNYLRKQVYHPFIMLRDVKTHLMNHFYIIINFIKHRNFNFKQVFSRNLL